jgi:antitoxin (DNA-binding transcriptional repressor) of toxin-antitoxin stability system
MTVSAQYAEEHFADILHAADSGEEVENTWVRPR